MEKIKQIEEVKSLGLGNQGLLNGQNGSRLGMSGMIGSLFGGSNYDGYKVVTTEHTYLILIDNGQSCCESWGYLSTNDDVNDFVGANLLDFKLTDTALNTKKLSEESRYIVWNGKIDLDAGGIQFVDIETDKGVLQFAVYNSHNGYYGHPILIAKDNEILLSDTL